METVKGLCYFGGKLNASGGCEAAGPKEHEGNERHSECGEILFGKRFFFQIKGKVCKSYARLAMLYGSEVTILRRAERSMVRAMCGVKLVDKKNTEG